MYIDTPDNPRIFVRMPSVDHAKPNPRSRPQRDSRHALEPTASLLGHRPPIHYLDQKEDDDDVGASSASMSLTHASDWQTEALIIGIT